MNRTNRFLGAVLIISGTSIGAGMLAIPVMSSFCGFLPSIFLFFIIWLVMLATAFMFLDVNLSMNGDVNLITMAQNTLGTKGRVVSWIAYLLLLYSLTAAYIAASAPIFISIIKYITGFTIPMWMANWPLLILFIPFVYLGTKSTDYINRFLMLGLIIGYGLLIIFVPKYMDLNLLTHVDFKPMLIGIPVIITSFGYHIVIPSLVTYMSHDVKKLKIAIVVGSIIPLIIYIAWQFLVLGTLSFDGRFGLVQAYKNGASATEPLRALISNPYISLGAGLFGFFAIITSFLGVVLSLTDFLIDGFHLEEIKKGRFVAVSLALLPPLIFVYIYERGFYLALDYAAIFVVILLIIMPALMVRKIKTNTFFKTKFGKIIILLVILISVFVIIDDIASQSGLLTKTLTKYLK
jgi:tyrosine-specific transport protein